MRVVALHVSMLQVPVDPVTMRADARATARSMSANTIMVYASAPSYPHGVIDPVQDLAKLARKHGVSGRGRGRLPDLSCVCVCVFVCLFVCVCVCVCIYLSNCT